MQHDTCHDALESELGSRAKVNFANLLEKAGLCPQAPSRNWHFAESVAAIEPHIATACSLQLQFLQNLQRNWRPSHSEKFQLPDEWKPKAEDRTCAIRPAEFFDPFALHLFLESLSDHVSFLSHAEVVNRHLDPTSCKPDFLLFTRHRLVEHDEDYSTLINPPETAFTCNARVLLSYFKDVVTCEGDELSAEYSIPGIFTSTPGCWLRCNPEFDFPPPFGTPRSFPPVDFAVLFHPIGPSRRFSFGRDQHLRMDVLHPALVLGVKGPIPWPDSSNDEPSSSLDEILHNLALSIQPNLDTHLLNWFLLCEQAETPSHNCLALPPWMVLFGVVYDAECIRLVAHIPFVKTPSTITLEFSYLSCIIDTISFPPMPVIIPSLEAWSMERFRAAFALLSVRTHAFELGSRWECVIWPPSILMSTIIRESEYLGQSPTPSNRGDMSVGGFDIAFSTDSGSEPDSPTSTEHAEYLRKRAAAREREMEDVRPAVKKWLNEVYGSGLWPEKP